MLEYAGEDFNTNQTVQISAPESTQEQAGTAGLAYNSEYGDVYKMMVQMMQLQMQQKLQSILDFGENDSGNESSFL